MRKFATILIVIGFSAITVFGIFAMNHGHNEAGCIAASAQGATCPNTENTLSFIAFHLGAFKNFSTATFIVTALLSIAILLSTAGSLVVAPSYSGRQLFSLSVPLLKQRLTRWLALHENSPSLI